MSLTLDHVIIAVDDLDTAVEDYRELGFTVIYGGEHASGTTHNALIIFRDGSYLELLALTGKSADPESDATDFSHLLEQGEGLVGYALGSDDLDMDTAAMRERGLDVGQPQRGSRLRTDNVRLEWKTVSIGSSMSPFFIEDVTDRTLRVPDEDDITTHDNRVIGIAGLTFVFANVERATLHYEAMLGKPPQRSAQGTIFDLSNTRLLLDPEGQQANLADATPYRLVLETDATSRTGMIQMSNTHGVRMLVVDTAQRHRW